MAAPPHTGVSTHATPSVWRVVELAGLGAAFDASFEPGPDPVQELALF